MKLLSLLILFCFTLNLFAADTVRINDPANLVMTGLTSTTFTLGSDSITGDATTEASPARVYVPMTNNAVDHDKYFSQYNAGVTVLFDTTNVNNVINFPLRTAITGTVYLYAAAKLSTGTGYKVVQRYSSTASTSTDLTFGVSPKAICAQYDCSTIESASVSNSKVIFTLYFYLSTNSNLPLGDPVVPAGTDGVFFEVQMSNRIYLATDLRVFITNSRKGDSRVILDYTSDQTMLDFKKITIFKHSTIPAPATTNQPIGLYAGTLLDRDFPGTETGEVTVNQLPNGVDATLSVLFQDKFGFATTLSDDVTVVPTEIQELLKKQACYLLTAGFGEEHYVITFFRHYRDHVLANTWIGKQFIKIYYRSAPHYAVIIYQSEWMRLAIRSAAYSLYFVFNYYWLVLIFLISCYYLNLRKNKILFQKNRL
ncbi:MAG: hypothetical protein PHY93_15480 [Bacteriovorax sp.]|nr:hypothetical protein [Bacteriovorax sp.]